MDLRETHSLQRDLGAVLARVLTMLIYDLFSVHRATSTSDLKEESRTVIGAIIFNVC